MASNEAGTPTDSLDVGDRPLAASAPGNRSAHQMTQLQPKGRTFWLTRPARDRITHASYVRLNKNRYHDKDQKTRTRIQGPTIHQEKAQEQLKETEESR